MLRNLRRGPQHRGATAQDGRFELVQRGPRVEAHLGRQDRAGPAQRRQRVGLPARRPQRQRVQPPAFLPQRLVEGEQFGLGYGHRGIRRPQPGDHVQLAGDQPQLVQPGDLGPGPGVVDELGVRRAPPQRQRLAEQAPRRLRLPLRDLARLAQQPLEPPGVDGTVRQAQRVPGWCADQQGGRSAWCPAGLQQPSQVRHVDLK